MPSMRIDVDCPVRNSARLKQVQALTDIPVGPSGCGKSTVARRTTGVDVFTKPGVTQDTDDPVPDHRPQFGETVLAWVLLLSLTAVLVVFCVVLL